MSEPNTLDSPKTQEPTAGPAPARAESSRTWVPAGRQRLILYAVGGALAALLLLALGVYVWKALAIARLERQFETEREQSSTARQQALAGQAREMLLLSARPLAWAVRAELLRGNLAQVDEYFREYVREHGVQSLVLVGQDGTVTLASNRKLETLPADGLLSRALLEATEPRVEEAGSALRLAVPVMGFDRRLGVLVIDYDPKSR